MVQQLKRQKDMLLLREKDYIANPKKNGYQSYHLVFGFPVYGIDDMEYYPVEVQIRTLTMDLWASMEHRVIYKSKHVKTQERYEQAKEAFQQFGIELSSLERSMHQLVVPSSKKEGEELRERKPVQEKRNQLQGESSDEHLSERGENKIGNIFSKNNKGNAVLYTE